MVLKSLVRGYTWKCRMGNGAVFEYWTPSDIFRGDARKELLRKAKYYEPKDIESLWRTIG